MKNPLEELLALYDNISLAARELQCSRQNIYDWKHQGYIPYRRGKDIEKKTGGRIKASDIWQAASQRMK